MHCLHTHAGIFLKHRRFSASLAFRAILLNLSRNPFIFLFLLSRRPQTILSLNTEKKSSATLHHPSSFKNQSLLIGKTVRTMRNSASMQPVHQS